MSALPRPASRDLVAAEAKEEKEKEEKEKPQLARRYSLRAADTLTDLLGSIGRPSFFRNQNSKSKEKSTRRKSALTGICLVSCLRTEDGITYLRKFCRQFPGQRKYLEFWLAVGGKGGFKDAWNNRGVEERAADAEKIAAQYLRVGSEHLLNEGGIKPMPNPLASISVGMFNEAGRLARVIIAKEARAARQRRWAEGGERGTVRRTGGRADLAPLRRHGPRPRQTHSRSSDIRYPWAQAAAQQMRSTFPATSVRSLLLCRADLAKV